ncbi:cysteine sulfinate desulfinase [Anaerolinea thermolimosa]|nr:cysteine desulfurase family protein [Anaerolinea thermolimosa]GAP06577.1 cysteine sulfinate desulfinase [Anaerolinea thermolimosa]
MAVMEKVYLDFAATTPLDDRVFQAMLPYFKDFFGNPSSVHEFGQVAEGAVENARETVARCLNASPREIVFTSCGTESDNLALRGVAWAQRKRHGFCHILTTPVEHHAVLHTVNQLSEQGFEIEFLPVDSTGMVDPEAVRSHLRRDTALVSVIYANNEIGTINPVAEIGLVCRERNIPFHTDAVQAAAHLPIDVLREHIDLLSIGAHKFYGPKGVGALYIRQGTPIEPVQTGGKQESGLRAGTHNVPYIVGLAEALQITKNELPVHSRRFLEMRDTLVNGILQNIPQTRLTGHPRQRLPNHVSFVFKNLDGNRLLMALDVAGYACSSGSACKTGDPRPSEVLTAIGLPEEWALGSLRVTLGRSTTPQMIEAFTGILPELIRKQRSLS